MLNLLRRLFIKDYKNVESEDVRLAHGKLASIVGIVINVILVALKIVFGVIASSIALIADALNNISDVASSAVTLVGFKIAGKPADKEHPFGHQRLEYIAGLIVSIIIICIAVVLFTESLDKILSASESNYTLWTFIILGVSILLKIFQFATYYYYAKLVKSVALKATAFDSLGDILATTIILVGALITYFTGVNLDGYLGIITAIFVLVAGVRFVIETSSPLIGEGADKELINNIVEDVKKCEGIYGVHDVLMHSYGPKMHFISMHVEVDGSLSTFENHKFIDSAESMIKEKYDVEPLMHADPIDLKDEFSSLIYLEIKDLFKNLNKDFVVHELKIENKDEKYEIRFELTYPYSEKRSEKEINSIVLDKINELHPDKHFEVNISFERPYFSEQFYS